MVTVNANRDLFLCAGSFRIFGDRYHLHEIQHRGSCQLQALNKVGLEIRNFAVLDMD